MYLTRPVFCVRRGWGADGAPRLSPPWQPSGPRSGAGITGEFRASQLEHSFIWSKVSRRSFGFVNTVEEDFHLDPATDQSQKMTNFKLTSLSLFLKQINHYNNIHRRVSELIRCLEIKVGWFSLSHQPPARAAGQSRHRRITPEFSDLIKVSAGAKLWASSETECAQYNSQWD